MKPSPISHGHGLEIRPSVSFLYLYVFFFLLRIFIPRLNMRISYVHFSYTQFQYECAAITKSKDGSRTVKYSLGRLMRSDANWLVRGR